MTAQPQPQPHTEAEGTELVIARQLNAPREVVFRAFAEAAQLAQWWGPKGCRIEARHLDFRPGGRFLYGMHMGRGPVIWGKFEYVEISAPEKIMFVNSFADEAGATVRAPFSSSWPLEMRNVLTLTEEDHQTTLTLRVRALNASAEEERTFAGGRDSVRQGFGGTLERLAEFLAESTSL